jgi:adenylyltransferase/sulfurtransferase
LWKKEFKGMEVLGKGKCTGCKKGEYPYLSKGKSSRTVTLCGRNAVQIYQTSSVPVNFQNLARKLSGLGAVKYNDFLLKAEVAPFEITVFQNGRAIIQGTEDAVQAKSIYAKYIGG